MLNSIHLLEVTADGLGILPLGAATADGLIVQDVSFCGVYALMGEHAIALAQDSLSLDHELLREMLEPCGRISTVHFGHADDPANALTLARHLRRRDALVRALDARVGNVVVTTSSICRFYVDGRFFDPLQGADRRMVRLSSPVERQARMEANLRHSYLTLGMVAPDLQWDMGRPTPLPEWASEYAA